MAKLDHQSTQLLADFTVGAGSVALLGEQVSRPTVQPSHDGTVQFSMDMARVPSQGVPETASIQFLAYKGRYKRA